MRPQNVDLASQNHTLSRRIPLRTISPIEKRKITATDQLWSSEVGHLACRDGTRSEPHFGLDFGPEGHQN